MCAVCFASVLYSPAFLRFSQWFFFFFLVLYFSFLIFFPMSIKTWFVTLLNLEFLFSFLKMTFPFIFELFAELRYLVSEFLEFLFMFTSLFLCHFPAGLVPLERHVQPVSHVSFCISVFLTCGMLCSSFFSYEIWIWSLSLFLSFFFYCWPFHLAHFLFYFHY